MLQQAIKIKTKHQTMKKIILSLGFIIITGTYSLYAQESLNTSVKYLNNKNTPVRSLTPPDITKLQAEDIERDHKGLFYRIGVGTYTHFTPENSGVWSTLPNGDKLWQLTIKFPGAEALSFIFSKFRIYDNSIFSVFNSNGELLNDELTKNDVADHGQQNIALCFGDEMTLQLTEPKGSKSSEIELSEVMYGYRSTGNPNVFVQKINESGSCEINVNCPEGNNWKDERNGVARILVKEGNQQGWCSGSLINNVAKNCKPYFLTALHCGVNSSTADFNAWKFYFKYEATGCTNPTSQGSLGGTTTTITGCHIKATSKDGGGDTGSDFLLVQLGTASTEAATITKLKSTPINAYWNGWDANNTASSAGAGIHHPAGDIKKISTYTNTLTTTGWDSNGLQSHWRVTWASTVSGRGVTEGGSSGSPLFTYNNGNSRIVGTLTGGSSSCSSQSSPDVYGKVSFHWNSNTTAGNIPLKQFLDPANSGLLVLDGSYDPCFGGIPASIQKKDPLSNVKIYPNPINEKLVVDLTGVANYGKVTIDIYDVMGQFVRSYTSQAGSTMELNMSDISKGMYQIVVATDTSRSIQRVIKE